MARRYRAWLRSAGVSGGLLAAAALSVASAQGAAGSAVGAATGARPYAPPVPSPGAVSPTTATPPDADGGADGDVPGADGDPGLDAPDADMPGAPDPEDAAPDPSDGTPTATPSASGTPDPAAGTPASLPALLTQLQSLYQQTEAATEAFNQAKVAADQLRKAAEAADGRLAGQRTAVAAARNQLGLLAREMYRGGAVSPYLSMLTGETPQDFFGRRHAIEHAADRQRAVLARLSGGVAALSALNARAQHALDAAQVAQGRQAARKTQVEARLRQVEGLLAGLSSDQISGLQALEEQDADKAQQDFMDGKPLGADVSERAPSASGDRALGYAFQQLGKPYAWGAQGPAAFDCSGLTSQSWASAGVAVPRTSEQQWARLPRVPLAELRPGDLVVYFPTATHVALYIGDGLVIEAPRPGATVRVSPVAVHPVLGAVRPDQADPPLTDYHPRPIPPGAEQPTPLGPTQPH